ncbi:hypothetical protein H0H93_013665 [Arthromyces matolae]|nr:hypothetical protein H0H93_013665 [Arthromyces matolae]
MGANGPCPACECICGKFDYGKMDADDWGGGLCDSVIVLSLHYIYRLKDRNRFTPAQPGSEFRIAVAGFMMANKFLGDNTYTNETRSEVYGIELFEINRMEKEFLMGVISTSMSTNPHTNPGPTFSNVYYWRKNVIVYISGDLVQRLRPRDMRFNNMLVEVWDLR